MELCYSWDKRPIRLSSNKRYTPEEIRDLCVRVSPPFWLSVEQVMIPVAGEDCLWLACQTAAAYHGWIAYNAPEEDGFAEDMKRREMLVQQHMEEPSSDESDTFPEDEF